MRQPTKAELRLYFRNKRARYAVHVKQSYESAILQKLGNQLKKFNCVASYLDYGSEPPTKKLLDYLANKGVKVLVPYLSNGSDPKWTEYVAGAPILNNGPNKMPSVCDTEVLPSTVINEAEVVLVPALACDIRGNRLGQGGGWYDRALLHTKYGISIIAITYDWENPKENIIPVQDHDVAMTHIFNGLSLHRVH